MKALLVDRPIEIAETVPDDLCDQVIARLQGPFTPCQGSKPKEAALVLLSAYPYAFKDDRDLKLPYMRRIEAVFAEFPQWAVNKVIAVRTGLAARCKFLPSEHEVVDALDQELGKAETFVAKAKQHKRENQRRMDIAAENDRIDADKARHTPEQRAAMASAIIAKAFQTIDQEVIA